MRGIEGARGRWTGRVLRGLGVVGALLLLVLSLVKGDWPSEPSYGNGWPVPLSVKASILRSLLALVAGLALAWMPSLAPWRERAGRWLFHSPRRRIQWVLGTAAFLLYAGVAWFRFKGLPFLDDDAAALFQARIFAAGRLTLPVPKYGQFFSLFGLLGRAHEHPFVCTMYPPGLSLLLLPGVLAGVPWLMIPVTGGLLVAATITLGAELAGERVGRLAGLFMLGSPFIGILSGTHLSHIPTAGLLVVCWLAVVRLLRTGRIRHGVMAGAAWGAACLFRPLTALVVGVVVALGVLVQWRRALAAWRGVLAALLLAVAGGALLAAWQQATVGAATAVWVLCASPTRAPIRRPSPGTTPSPACARSTTVSWGGRCLRWRWCSGPSFSGARARPTSGCWPAGSPCCLSTASTGTTRSTGRHATRRPASRCC